MSMHSEVTPFCFGDNLVRVIKDSDDNPWFVGKDVAGALGYANTRKAIRDHCKKAVSIEGNDSFPLGRTNRSPLHPQTQLISEPDVYRLIIKSHLPEAERFEAWIFEEVLPTIRKTGFYHMPGTAPGEMPENFKQSKNMYFAMARLVEGADKYLEGKAALKTLNYFTGMPVDDLLEELEDRRIASEFASSNLGAGGQGKDAVALWVAERCDIGDEYSEKASVLYRDFSAWAKERGVLSRPMSVKAFGILIGNFFDRVKSSVIFYTGVRLAE